MTPGRGPERFLVTGALGCIGAWTVRELIRDGASVVGYDVGTNPRRLALVMTPDELARVTFVAGDWHRLQSVMRLDKKARGASLRFVVLDGLGKPTVLTDPDQAWLDAAWAAVSHTEDR